MPSFCLLSDLVAHSRLASGELDPTADAITDGSIALNWAEYVDRVSRVATVLSHAGVRAGDRVAVRLPKSADSFVAAHAVVRVGGVFVPIDPLAPAAVTAAVIADAGARVLITDVRTVAASDRPSVDAVLVPGATVDAELDGVQVFDETSIEVAERGEPVAVEPADPAYIIYTSGSTGHPKGIVHTHESALAYARAAVDAYALTSADRFANIAPLHFDQSTFELYAASLAGGAVLTVPDPVLRFPASVTELVDRFGATVW